MAYLTAVGDWIALVKLEEMDMDEFRVGDVGKVIDVEEFGGLVVVYACFPRLSVSDGDYMMYASQVVTIEEAKERGVPYSPKYKHWRKKREKYEKTEKDRGW